MIATAMLQKTAQLQLPKQLEDVVQRRVEGLGQRRNCDRKSVIIGMIDEGAFQACRASWIGRNAFLAALSQVLACAALVRQHACLSKYLTPRGQCMCMPTTALCNMIRLKLESSGLWGLLGERARVHLASLFYGAIKGSNERL